MGTQDWDTTSNMRLYSKDNQIESVWKQSKTIIVPHGKPRETNIEPPNMRWLCLTILDVHGWSGDTGDKQFQTHALPLRTINIFGEFNLLFSMFLYLLRKAQLSLQWIFFLENKTAKSIIFRTPYISWWILVIDTSPWNCWHPHGFVAAPWSHHGQELGFCFKLSFRDFRSCSVRSWTPESKKQRTFLADFHQKQGLFHLRVQNPLHLAANTGNSGLLMTGRSCGWPCCIWISCKEGSLGM